MNEYITLNRTKADIQRRIDEQTEEDKAYDFKLAAIHEGCSIDELKKRLMIQCQNAVYIRGQVGYKAPVRASEVACSVERDLAYAPIALTVGRKKRPKTFTELQEFRTVARFVRCSMLSDKSSYDPKTETFIEAICPKRSIEPKFSDEIQTWLKLLGGRSEEKLLDWIATVPRLDRQTAALYLSHTPSAGKTMLADNLARLWSTQGPATLKGMLEHFNDEILMCPLVFGDEVITGANASARLRALIGSSHHKLNRKFIPTADIEGCPRFILSANHDSLLAFDEALGVDDHEALAKRFLHIKVGIEAKDYLEALGGRSHTESWVAGDEIAAHTLWLAKNRDVKAGNRFLVEGDARQMADNLLTNGVYEGFVCEWIARAIDSSRSLHPGLPMLIVGEGEVLVNTNTLLKNFEFHVKTSRVVNATRVGKALANLSQGERRVDGSRYHSVKVKLVLEWASRNLQMDEEAMLAKINGPRVRAPGNVISMAG